ncbi:MAG: enoyl-CoA hydratase-related protein [Actinomycetota bacterium]
MAITTDRRGDVRVVTIDDGRANVLGPAEVAALRAAVAGAGPSEGVVLTGRDGMFSGGLDLGVLGRGGAEAEELLAAMGALLVDVLRSPRPVVVAASGHAVAAGAMLMLAADRALVAVGDHRVGFTEVAGGMALPPGVVELARATVAAPWLRRLTAQGELIGPEDAVAAGFAATAVPPEALLDEAVAAASRLAALDAEAFARTKRLVNGSLADRLAGPD